MRAVGASFSTRIRAEELIYIYMVRIVPSQLF